MRQHTPYTYGMDNDEPWEREERDANEDPLEAVIVEGTVMSYRNYQRGGEGVGGP